MTVLGVGAVFFSENYYLSLSCPQIISNTFKANQENLSTTSNYRTIYLSGGYIFGFPGKVCFRPNLLIASTIGKPTYYDAAAIVYLPPVFQFGFNVRSTGSVCFFTQFNLTERIKLSYAMDYSVTTNIRKFQLGTHEIMIGYDFNIYKRKFNNYAYF
jgi:type IX secretion system PorP/SprF family membrane protein